MPAEGDFEAVVPLDVLRTFPGSLEFENRAVEVTGLVEEYRGRPQIMIGLPAQVKVSDSYQTWRFERALKDAQTSARTIQQPASSPLPAQAQADRAHAESFGIDGN